MSRLHITLDKEGRDDSAGEVCLSVRAVGGKGCQELSRLANESVGPGVVASKFAVPRTYQV